MYFKKLETAQVLIALVKELLLCNRKLFSFFYLHIFTLSILNTEWMLQLKVLKEAIKMFWSHKSNFGTKDRHLMSSNDWQKKLYCTSSLLKYNLKSTCIFFVKNNEVFCHYDWSARGNVYKLYKNKNDLVWVFFNYSLLLHISFKMPTIKSTKSTNSITFWFKSYLSTSSTQKNFVQVKGQH